LRKRDKQSSLAKRTSLKVTIIGLGGIGASIADQFLLKRRDCDFDLRLVVREDTAKDIFKQGIKITNDGSERVHQIAGLISKLADLPKQDLIFLCTKMLDNKSISSSLVEVSHESTILIPLQNGLSKRTEFKRMGFKGSLVDAVVRACSHKISNVEIDVKSFPSIILGKINNSHRQQLESFFSGTEIDVTYRSDSIEGELLEKFGFVVVVSAVTCLFQGPCSIILKDKAAFELFSKLCDEYLLFAEHHSHPLEKERFITSAITSLKSMPPNNYSSMTIDFLKGKSGELFLSLEQIVSEVKSMPYFIEIYNKLKQQFILEEHLVSP